MDLGHSPLPDLYDKDYQVEQERCSGMDAVIKEAGNRSAGDAEFQRYHLSTTTAWH